MIRTLLKEVKEYKAASIVTPLFMILEVLMETVIPFLMASIIDKGVETGDIHHIYKVGGIMVRLLLADWLREWQAVGMELRLPPDLQRICGRQCLRGSRHFPLQITDHFSYSRSGHKADD